MNTTKYIFDYNSLIYSHQRYQLIKPPQQIKTATIKPPYKQKQQSELFLTFKEFKNTIPHKA